MHFARNFHGSRVEREALSTAGRERRLLVGRQIPGEVVN